MQLLDLPPEVFHSIMEAYIASTSFQSDLKNLQLVNSELLEDHKELVSKYGARAFEVRLPHYDSLPANIHLYESLPVTALEAAAQNAHGEIVYFLLQQEFHISRSSLNYQRAIVFASMRGDADILKTLIRSVNFDPLPEKFPQALWDHTLRFSVYKGQTKIISLLLEKGADVNRMNFDDMNPGYCTPLGLAALNGQHEAILFLLQMGADINRGGTHPIAMAALRGHSRTMELLLNLGAEVLPFQSTFLEIAVGDGEDEIVRVYLERGLHLIPGCPEKGKHALKLARSDGHSRVIRVFEEFGITESSFS